MKYLRISLVAQFLLAVYFQMVNWFSLGSWNDQPGFVPLSHSALSGTGHWGDVGLVGCFLLPFLLFSLAYWKRWNWLMWVGAVGYTAWLYLQVQTWWVPYLFGASDHWQETYHRVFAHSTQVLPSFGNHLAPDGMHLVIHLLLLAIIPSLIVGLVQTRRSKKPAEVRNGSLTVPHAPGTGLPHVDELLKGAKKIKRVPPTGGGEAGGPR